MRRLVNKLRSMDRGYVLFLLAGACLGIGQSVDGSTLTNYLKENLHMLIVQRSALEFPRELPGLLVFLVMGVLSSLGDIRMAVIANIVAAAGMFLLGVIQPDYIFVVLVMFIYSMGQHLYMPLANSIGMKFAGTNDLGRRLGQQNAVNTAALVISSAALWALFKFVHISYTTSFTVGAIAFLAAAVLLSRIKPARTAAVNTRYIFRKEYRLYYWLCMLYGARKQIFITFGPWVLVDVFKQPVTTMTVLFFIIAVTGIVVKPLVGYLIDRVGERLILTGEAVAFLFVCLGYAFAENLFKDTIAVTFICGCYVLDQTLTAVNMARATYLKKIAITEQDVSPTLSVGTSIDHLITMFLPIIGGLVWYNSGPGGYRYVFIGGAVIALINFLSTRMIRIPRQTSLIEDKQAMMSHHG